MKTWVRTRVDDRVCGRCGDRPAVGDPVLVYPQWGLVRCVKCADEPAPADVAALPDTMPSVNRARHTVRASLRQPALDAKQRQLGGDQ